MKALMPWMCLVIASASQQAIASEEFEQYRLGNYNKAIEPLISQSGQNAVADYYLGRLYLYGYGQLKNTTVAMRYFNQAAEKGYLPAIQLLAKYTLLNDKDPEGSIKWFKKAAAEGDVSAQMFMAASYMYGVGVKQNPDVARKYYIDAAKQGNSIAQFALAEYFIDSRHSANTQLGLIWLGKSAAAGNLNAMTKLGLLYIEGNKVDQDVARGVDLLNKAAARHYAPAMIGLGEAAQAADDYKLAIEWFNKALQLKDKNAYLSLAHVYLKKDSPVYDANAGFLWTLKAAQEGVVESKGELAQLYKHGIGVAKDEALAKEWASQAANETKKPHALAREQRAALWISNGASTQLQNTVYQMDGILSNWHNTAMLRDNIYNQAPRMEFIARDAIYKPQFTMVQPNEVPINTYYDALIDKTSDFQANQWTYPSYRLNPQIEALQKQYSKVVAQNKLPAPYVQANYFDYDDYSNSSLMDMWTPGWQEQVNYRSVFNKLYSKAILGEAQSQFEIGQMFEYGLGVAQSYPSAIAFYQNAAEQHHLGAEYNLGLLYLQHPQDATSYQTALNWLTDSAFKGNKRAQYVLARVLNQSRNAADGTVIEPNREQALSMLYLAAANNFGPAQYALAETLVRQLDNGLSLTARQHKIDVIRSLYQSAAANGVRQALIPLAFYNAIDNDKSKQAQAFKVAKEQADNGDGQAALLLAMLYDRGIGVTQDSALAISWYQKAGKNPVTDFILGTYTYEGKGIAADKNKGMDSLIQSAEAKFSFADFNLAALSQQSGQNFLPELRTAYNLGNSHAGIVLADYYLSQSTEKQNLNLARSIYQGLAEKGSQDAQLKLAYMMAKGLGAAANEQGAQRWFLASAEQGNPVAQFMLGQLYQTGALGEPDYQQAKEWYQKAASQLPKAAVALGFLYETVDDNYADALKAYQQAAAKGDATGVYNLALMYFYGKGMPVNYEKAKSLFSEAAAKGSAQAMTQLGDIYFKGLGQASDEQQGLSWYKKAADQGDASALYELGLLSETGVGVPADYAHALKYYQQASDKGDEKAMLALARMYQYGLGVAKNPKTSADIYTRLAEKKNAFAQYKLGVFFLEGIACDSSAKKAKQWLQQASDNGSIEAQHMLQKIEAQGHSTVSFLQPVLFAKPLNVATHSANLMYMDALNEWDRGKESVSRVMLHHLVTQYPQFELGKKTYDELNRNSPGTSS